MSGHFGTAPQGWVAVASVANAQIDVGASNDARQVLAIVNVGVAYWSLAAISADDLRGLLDLSPREYAVFAPLIVLTIWMGIYPQSFLSFFEASVAALVERHHAALGAARLAGV